MDNNDLYAILKESHKLYTMLEEMDTGESLHPEAESQVPQLKNMREAIFEFFGGVNDTPTYELLEKPDFLQFVRGVDPDFSLEMESWYTAH